MTAAAPSVTVISVAFNSAAVLPAMLGSIPEGVPVVLVDNASADGAALDALAAEHGARLIRNAENRGFGAACNQGAAGASTEFLLFLNPDAALGPGALDALAAAAARHPEAVAFNPRIEEADGSAYFKRQSVILPRNSRMPRGWPADDRAVPVLSGAALFVRREAFEAVGGFDEAIFLYHEDDDLSLRLAERGALMFIRDALVRHQGGRSTVRSPEVAALKAWHMGRSRVYAARKHGRPAAFARALAAALLQAARPDALILKRKRAKQRAFLRGVLSARRDMAAGKGAG
jgi:GT2 family glycosyltransferase